MIWARSSDKNALDITHKTIDCAALLPGFRHLCHNSAVLVDKRLRGQKKSCAAFPSTRQRVGPPTLTNRRGNGNEILNQIW